MKPHILVGLVLALVALVVAVFYHPRIVESDVATTTPEIVYKGLTPAQIIWLARLMDCESGIDDSAINPNDLDNTPSWGILQFKPSTFAAFAKRYEIDAELMDAEAQVSIVVQWLLREDEVTWSQQFPGCVRKIGLPPVK